MASPLCRIAAGQPPAEGRRPENILMRRSPGVLQPQEGLSPRLDEVRHVDNGVQ